MDEFRRNTIYSSRSERWQKSITYKSHRNIQERRTELLTLQGLPPVLVGYTCLAELGVVLAAKLDVADVDADVLGTIHGIAYPGGGGDPAQGRTALNSSRLSSQACFSALPLSWTYPPGS